MNNVALGSGIESPVAPLSISSLFADVDDDIETVTPGTSAGSRGRPERPAPLPIDTIPDVARPFRSIADLFADDDRDLARDLADDARDRGAECAVDLPAHREVGNPSPPPARLLPRPALSRTFFPAAELPFLLSRIETLPSVVVKITATAPSPFSAPTRVSQDAPVTGTMSLRAYATATGSGWSADVRCRTVSMRLEDGAVYFIDLDEDGWRQRDRDGLLPVVRLVRALHEKIWVGHNLLHEYIWLKSIAPEVRPSRILDTMLLATACRADLEADLHDVAASALVGPDDDVHACSADIYQRMERREKSRKQAGDPAGLFSLDLLSLYFLKRPAPRFSIHAGWMPARLQGQHLDYLDDSLSVIVGVAEKLVPDTAGRRPADWLRSVEAMPGGRAYRIFEDALHGLVAMHHKGIGFSTEIATRNLDGMVGQVGILVQAVCQEFPELCGFETALKEGRLTGGLRKAIAAGLKRLTGTDLPVSEKDQLPLTGKDHLIRTFGPVEPVKLLVRLFEEQKNLGILRGLRDAAAIDDRIHPIVGITTRTGRTAATQPSLQAIPADAGIHECFVDASGGTRQKIIKADYSAIEMVIASGLSTRAYNDAREVFDSICREIVSGGRNLARSRYSWLGRHGWFRWLLEKSSVIEQYAELLLEHDGNTRISVEYPKPRQESERWGIGQWADSLSCEFVYWIEHIRRQGGLCDEPDKYRLTLAMAIRAGVDPHLATAISILDKRGDVDLGGDSPIAWLARQTPQDRHDLAARFAHVRRKSKALNFGLLYGMQPPRLHEYGILQHGLEWSLDEAAQASVDWFTIYPEIGLWQFWNRVAGKQKAEIVDFQNGRVVGRKAGGKMILGSTISGRPTCSLRQSVSLNNQDQGSAAEIALDALARLFTTRSPCSGSGRTLGDYLVMFVHDEFVFSADEADQDIPKLIASIETTLGDIASAHLKSFALPVKVSVTCGYHW